MSKTPMVSQVNALIGNMLAAGESVFLPEVGTLYQMRVAARDLGKGYFMPAQRLIAFMSAQSGQSLVDRIATEANCSQEQALDVYQRWLEQVQEFTNIDIEGVGRLNHKTFVMDEQFTERLNPHREPMKIKQNRTLDKILMICGGVAVVVAIAVFASLWRSDRAAEPVELHAGKLAEHRHTQDSIRSAEQSKRDSVVAAAVVVPATPMAQTEPVALVSKDYYVVLGVFSTAENAMRSLESVKGEFPGAGAYIYGGKFMVSLFSSADELEANTQARDARNTHSGAWVYRAK